MLNNLKPNLSSLDRGIRLLIAALALYFAVIVYPSSMIGTILLIVALIMGVTGAIGFCGLYKLLGIHTNKS